MAKKSTKRSKKKTEPQVIEEIQDVRPMDPMVEDVAIATESETPSGPTGLTRLADYYEEPEEHLTASQLEAIREDAYAERFGAPIRDFREGVVARLNDKLRS